MEKMFVGIPNRNGKDGCVCEEVLLSLPWSQPGLMQCKTSMCHLFFLVTEQFQFRTRDAFSAVIVEWLVEWKTNVADVNLLSRACGWWVEANLRLDPNL